MMNQSRFRFIRCETRKASSIVAELGKPSPASTSSAIAASAEYIAAAGTSAGNITIVNGYSVVSSFNAHSKAVNHLVFSRFYDNILSFCVLGDNNVNFTKIKDSKPSSTTRINLSSVPTFTNWHPSCSSVLAACESSKLNLLDTDRCCVVKSKAIDNGSLTAAEFSTSGAEISVACSIGSGSTGKIDIFDPRAEGCNAITTDVNIRPHCMMNLKSHEQLVILGQDQFRNPRLVWLDKRAFKSPIVSESLQLSAGICMCCYDQDTSLLSVSTRGSTNMLIFDLQRSDRLNHLTTYCSQTAFQAITAKPRRCLDVLSSEVGRIFQLTTASIEVIALTVPRKSKEFSSDLFPDAISAQPSLSFDEYLQGKNALPNMVSLNPNQQLLCDGIAENLPRQANESATEVLAAIDSNKSENRRKIELRLKKNLVAHVSGQETRSLDSLWFGLKASEVSMPLGMNLLLNSKFVVVPWKSLGASSVGVISIDKRGRIEAQTPLLRAHGQQMTCFTLSDLDPGLLITGCTDSRVRVWRFAFNRFDLDQPDLTEPEIDILTPGKVTFMSTNPVSSSVLAVASHAYNSAILSFYDVSSHDSSLEPKLCIDCHPEQITSLSFSDDGSLIATSSKDRICRIFDPRNSTKAPLSSFEMSEGVRDTYIIWIGQTGYILTIGFGNASSRQISIWSVLDSHQQSLEGGAQLVATHVIDQSNTTMVPRYDHDLGLLYVAGIGDRTILFFGIDLNKSGTELIEPLGKYMCSNPVSGIAFLPKTMCNVANVEVGSALYLTDDQIKPISFIVPRKRKEYFQDDLFPDTLVIEGGVSASDWFSGKNFLLSFRSLQPIGMERLSQAPPEAITGHQLKRLQFLNAEMHQEAQPTVEQHIQKQLSNVETATVVVNRWDAQPIQDKAVDEEEWD